MNQMSATVLWWSRINIWWCMAGCRAFWPQQHPQTWHTGWSTLSHRLRERRPLDKWLLQKPNNNTHKEKNTAEKVKLSFSVLCLKNFFFLKHQISQEAGAMMIYSHNTGELFSISISLVWQWDSVSCSLISPPREGSGAWQQTFTGRRSKVGAGGFEVSLIARVEAAKRAAAISSRAAEMEARPLRLGGGPTQSPAPLWREPSRRFRGGSLKTWKSEARSCRPPRRF